MAIKRNNENERFMHNPFESDDFDVDVFVGTCQWYEVWHGARLKNQITIMNIEAARK